MHSTVSGDETTPTSHMQIIAGFILRTTPPIVSPKIDMLALSLFLLCRDAFQSMLMNTTFALIIVLCSSSASLPRCAAAAIFK